MDASEAKIDNVILPVTYKVPVTVEEEETMLTWTVDTLSEVRWHSFFASCSKYFEEKIRAVHIDMTFLSYGKMAYKYCW